MADQVRSGPLRWVDNHCHPGVGARGADPEPLEDVLDDARSHGVIAMVVVGTDVASSRRCIDSARLHHDLWATAGVHPHDATEGTHELRDLVAEARSVDAETGRKLVAIGECGLDYHYDHSPRPLQREAFAEQVALAHEVGLPLVIHTRDAWDDTFAVLDEIGMPPRTVFHCFTGGPGEAQRCLERGAVLSVSGIVTFPGAAELRAAVAEAPLERLMVETDSPYLAPVPHRGKANRPAWVAHVGAGVAELHGVEVSEVARVTTANAIGFYSLDLV
ncbi:MAG: TatD family hydrolase [Microthrixaceae bacterium]